MQEIQKAQDAVRRASLEETRCSHLGYFNEETFEAKMGVARTQANLGFLGSFYKERTEKDEYDLILLKNPKEY